MSTPPPSAAIPLPRPATMADLQRYVRALEARMGWLDASCERTCFLMGEEVGELFGAVRRMPARDTPGGPDPDLLSESSREAVAEEIVDVLNYLLALANRLQIDVESAFQQKNARNQRRSWS